MGLTVREHLVLAHRARVARHRLWRDMLDPRSLLPPSPAENERVDGLLEVLKLTRVAKAPVAALPLGVVRLVEVGRALASDPHVLLLDEPLSGLDMKASENLLVGLQAYRRSERAMTSRSSSSSTTWPPSSSLSNTVFVLDFGERIAAGSPRRSGAIRQFEPPTWATASRPSGRRSTGRDRPGESGIRARDRDT